MPHDPAAVVRTLRTCRDAMIDLSRTLRPMGPAYKAADAVIAAIDAFAALLTGQRDYFHDIGSGATRGQVEAAQARAARERGDLPWE